jgi:hypothetical protein
MIALQPRVPTVTRPLPLPAATARATPISPSSFLPHHRYHRPALRGPDAVDFLEKMMARGVFPDLQNFSGHIEHLTNADDLIGMA